MEDESLHFDQEGTFSHAPIISEICNPIQDSKSLDAKLKTYCGDGVGGVRYSRDDDHWELDYADADDIPLYTREHISLLLREATSFRNDEGFTIKFPPCRLGTDCIGCSGSIPGLDEPVVLCASMTPLEYENLVRNGQSPQTNNLCILDERIALLEIFVVLSRQLVDLPDITDLTYQSYRCESDIDGQYDSAHMIMPAIERTNTILFPIVQPCLHKLRSYKVDAHGAVEAAWFIDDSALSWHVPMSPTMNGPSLADMLAAGDYPFGVTLSLN